MLTRRAALAGAALIAATPYVFKSAAQAQATNVVATAPVDLTSLPRREVTLVAPPLYMRMNRWPAPAPVSWRSR